MRITSLSWGKQIFLKQAQKPLTIMEKNPIGCNALSLKIVCSSKVIIEWKNATTQWRRHPP